ncbi:biopolymer transporter ExbB [Alphaproteobacteria bacterium GH1-50]|uniref:Biopolymer transporter ExbB n=1 Tax=Kangsaoukella pontilimi TaxID=2691042 RepID=A0A7C9MB45_9RHOB|nr:biopolymer transporter ExbB [Kangsaoukella pontilimi]MXQ08493.1 biopolymer transporter ExbB [Kangsaoukella pontilimi]
MASPDREAEPHFTRPYRQILTMLIVLGLVGFGAYVAYPQVAPVFLANPWLNGFIGFVFVIGVFACFWQVIQLISSVIWIEGFASDRPGHQFTSAPRLLASLAALLRKKGARMQLGATSTRSILDSVATRIDEARDITRYIVNLLIFLGLLGTFYGLATTVPAVVDTIRNLAPQEGDTGVETFSRLMTGLEAQLGGMGVAFASSLLGLAGSLVVGLLELFAGHGQNRFYRELEDWLSTITRVGFSAEEGGGADAGAISQLAEHMAMRLDQMQAYYAETESRREAAEDRLGMLANAVSRLADRMGEGDMSHSSPDQTRNAEAQERLAEALEALQRDGIGQVDAESRMRLRSMDVQMLRILEEMSAGRQESLGELRADLSELIKAVRMLARDRAM